MGKDSLPDDATPSEVYEHAREKWVPYDYFTRREKQLEKRREKRRKAQDADGKKRW